VDLRQIDWNANTVVELSTDLGIGQTAIAVPEDVCVTGDLHVGGGLVEVGGDEEDGFDVDTRPADGTNATPRLVLDSEVDLGHLWIVNDDDLDIEDDHDRGPFRDHDDGSDDAMQDAMAAACAPEDEERTAGEGK
jgi:hypothetical protein